MWQVCTFPDCGRPRVSFGLCGPHRIQRNRGRPLRPIGDAKKPRPVLISPDDPTIAIVQLTQGYVALIDAADRDAVAQWSWHVDLSLKIPYARRSIVTAGGSRSLGLHQFLWDYWKRPATPQIDHHDGNGLDCRSDNLRAATPAQNAYNKRLSKKNTSGFKGVRWKPDHQKWEARIKAAGKHYHLGYFDAPADAHIAYVAAAQRLHGEFACAG